MDATAFEVQLSSLENKCFNFSESVLWADEIGFSEHPRAYLESVQVYPRSYKDAFLFKIWLRTGQPLRGIQQPVLHCPPYYQVAHGSYLDFSLCPAELQPVEALWQYLFV
jgi:hypothetical protein